MKKSVVGLFLAFLITCCFFLSACIFDGSSKTIVASGIIYLNSSPLGDVELKTSTKTLTTSNQNGEFEISVRSNEITIYPEKAGYTFSPKSITLSEDVNNLIFVAEKIKDLNGSMSLAQVIITPTSISSFGDNFSYTQDGQSYLKINKFEVTVNKKTIYPINSNYHALKNKSNTIVVNDDITVETGVTFSISFRLNACFTMAGTEYVSEEKTLSILEIKEKQNTSNLNLRNQIEFTAVGINSSNNKFTYNVTFVFDYYKNV